MAILAVNKKAKHDYTVVETVEAGIELLGIEVKSVRAKRANIVGSFIHERGGELWLVGSDIPPWQVKNTPEDYDKTRSRKLLLHRKEIDAIASKLNAERLTMVPLSLYTHGGLIKVELGLVRSKTQYDKRETIKRREAERDVGRALKNSSY